METERPSAVSQGYADPEMLRAFFDEQDEEISNLYTLLSQKNGEIDALKEVIFSMLIAFEKTHPGLREVIAQDLSELSTRQGNFAKMAGEEYDFEACPFLEMQIAVEMPKR